MIIAITGYSARHKRRIRDLIAEHTDLKVTNKPLWLQELAYGLSKCAVLKKRTLLSYPEISVDQGMREVALVVKRKVFVIYVETSHRSAGAIILNKQAEVNKDIIGLTIPQNLIDKSIDTVKQNMKKALIGIWKD